MTETDKGSTAADVDGEIDYRQPQEFRLKFAAWRAAGTLAVIYVVNLAFNVIDAAFRGDLAFGMTEVGRMLLLQSPSDSNRFPSVVALVIGTTVFAILAGTSRLQYGIRKRRYRRRLAAFRQEQNDGLRRKYPDVSIDDKSDIESWVREVLANEPSERAQRLAQAKEWIAQDDLLAELVSLEIAKRRFARNLLGSIAAPAGAVIAARLLLLIG